jgi:dTDP-6-deoxy-L-talose 4-dehydrogenase (NAD+)
MKRRVLVTGASGFIGKYVVENLLQKGMEVTIASRNESMPQAWVNASVRRVFLDLSSLEPDLNYFVLLGSPDIVIHLAWEGLPNYMQDFHLTDNLPRHCLFLLNLMRHGLKDLTVAGTCLEYGMQEGCLSEEMSCFPSNPYAKAKNALRQYLEGPAMEMGVSFKWARLFYMYGKGQNPNSLTSQLDKAIEEGAEEFKMSGGQQVRDFLPVETMADYIVSVALQREVEGVINCCSGQPVKVLDFVEQYVTKRGARLNLNLGYYPYPNYEPMSFWGDDRKIQRIKNTV